jgi:hypothetical protein
LALPLLYILPGLSELPFPVTAPRTSGKPETNIFWVFQEMFTCFDWNFVLKKNPDMSQKDYGKYYQNFRFRSPLQERLVNLKQVNLGFFMKCWVVLNEIILS